MLKRSYLSLEGLGSMETANSVLSKGLLNGKKGAGNGEGTVARLLNLDIMRNQRKRSIKKYFY